MSEGRRARPQRHPRRSILDGHAGGANCACSAWQRLRQGLFSRRGRSARLRRAARSACSRERQGPAYSYVIHHRPVPGFTPPYGDRRRRTGGGAAHDDHITRLPADPRALELDMAVEVAFEKLDDEITLPLFRPARR